MCVYESWRHESEVHFHVACGAHREGDGGRDREREREREGEREPALGPGQDETSNLVWVGFPPQHDELQRYLDSDVAMSRMLLGKRQLLWTKPNL